jgi:hypothetical protein
VQFDDLEAVRARLDARAVAYEKVRGSDGADRLFCRDPAGNRWELQEASAGRPA